jgi:hypothetical protein
MSTPLPPATPMPVYHSEELYQAGGYDTCHVKLMRHDTTHVSRSTIELLVVAVHEMKSRRKEKHVDDDIDL